ncbi:hypothetical protein SELMODRAFT_74180 [Selaginella moellendorffii]|uniref:Pentacotripeptide-repeat region of PRORP domain-containing protein n=2 Tax=Selaginella moellendorffii TaxID=88036 RepID=D8QMS0_SELML|nr:hypothetical protein SELMODRAFT_74180 [Selaginella moellendorffii]
MPSRDCSTWRALLEAYARGGYIGLAEASFQRMPERNVVCWGALIYGYAVSGDRARATRAFGVLSLEGFWPTITTLGSVMSAFSSAGMAKECRDFFGAMVLDFGLMPRVEHYWLVVDALGRAGDRAKAEDLALSMPFQLDNVARAILLRYEKSSPI